MNINTKYNVGSPQMPMNMAAKEKGSPEEVILGSNHTDDTILMAEQLKHMKAADAMNPAFKAALEGMTWGMIGGLGAGVGASMLLKSLGVISGSSIIGTTLACAGVMTVAGGVISLAKANKQ